MSNKDRSDARAKRGEIRATRRNGRMQFTNDAQQHMEARASGAEHDAPTREEQRFMRGPRLAAKQLA